MERTHAATLDLGDVREAMTAVVTSLASGSPVAEAIATLEREGIRGAPVVDDGRVVGVVTLHDLAAEHPRPAGTGPFLRPHAHETTWTVDTVMTKTPVVAVPDEPLADAIVRMDELEVDRLPVIDHHGRPVGWLSAIDAIRAVAGAIRATAPASHHEHLWLVHAD